jgi:hypothetical protein
MSALRLDTSGRTAEVVSFPSASLNLESMIAPLSPESFFENHWRQKLLHHGQASSNGFSSVMRLSDIDRVFAASTSGVEDWFFFRADDVVNRSEFTTAQGQVMLNAVYALYRDGGTIHLRNTQRYLPSIESLWRALTQRFRAQVKCNLWITRSNEFAPYLHYDTHDIFVLQLHGSKQWTFYDLNPALFAPRAGNVMLDRRDVGAPAHVCTVKAGDLLYIPAGMPHEVITTGPHSVHLALGVFPLLWRDVLDAALVDLDRRGGGGLTDAVPPELLADVYQQGDGVALQQALGERLQQTTAGLNREALLSALATRLIEVIPPPADGHFFRELLQADEADAVQPDTLLQRRADAPAWAELDARGEQATIRFPGGGAMRAPAALLSTLQATAQTRTPFSAADLPEDFDLASRAIVLDELLQRGLLERVSR